MGIDLSVIPCAIGYFIFSIFILLGVQRRDGKCVQQLVKLNIISGPISHIPLPKILREQFVVWPSNITTSQRTLTVNNPGWILALK